jgi:MFS family permease
MIATSGRAATTAVLYLGMFLFAYTVPLASPAKDGIAATLGLAKAEDTWPVFTSYFLAWLVVIPPMSFLADRFGRKATLLAGALTLGAGMLLFSAARSLPLACAAQFLNGAGAIILQIVGVAALTDLYAEKRGSALTFAVGIVGLVALFSPLLMGEAQQRGVDWTRVYRVSAVLPFLVFVVLLLSRLPAAAQAAPVSLKTVGELLSSPLFLLLIASMLTYGIIEQGIPTWASSYVAELGASARWQGLVVTGYFVLMSLVRLLVGGLRLFEKTPHPRVVVLSSILGAVFLAAGTYTSNPVAATIFLSAAGGVIALIWPAIMTYATEATGKPTATVFGLVVGLGGATGCVIGSGVLGWIKQRGLSYRQSLLVLEIPTLLLLALFAGLALARRRPAPIVEPSCARGEA